jgi:hypothetical protein
MPSLKTIKWNGYKIGLYFPEISIRFITLNKFPIFWDTHLTFDLIVEGTKDLRKKPVEIKYLWQLFDSDDKLVKNDIGFYKIPRPTSYSGLRLLKAIEIRSLKPSQSYLIKMAFSIPDSQSIYFDMATFTTKDKDEIWMQIILAFISAVVAIIVALGFRVITG